MSVIRNIGKILKWTIWLIGKIVKISFQSIFGAVCILTMMACWIFYQDYWPTVEEYLLEAKAVANSSIVSDFKTVQTSYVYDCNGSLITKLKTDRDIHYVKYEEMPKHLVDATVAIEDKRFWEHDGVDWKSTAYAGVLYLKNSEEITRGGSTITQQLVKNIYLTNEKSLERKFKEIIISLGLEETYSKSQIIEFYLNNINYANGYYGIGAAAKGYFNKSVGELSLEEIAFLCAIPNNPSLYDPLTNIENTTRRRNLILKQMWIQNYVSEEEYLRASSSPIHFSKVKKVESSNYFTSYAIDCAIRSLMKRNDFNFSYSFNSKKGYEKYRKRFLEEYEDAKTKLYTGGYRVYTSLDNSIQKKVQQIVDEELSAFKGKKKGIYELQGAVTVVDNESGLVTAIVGGRSQKFNGVITLNRAFQSYRQPGSSIKPLIVYTPALERGFTPNSIVEDKYTEDGPKNSNGRYAGSVVLRSAVEQSKNVVAWNVFNSIGPETGLRYAQRMQFSKILPSDYNLASALGGLTYGVTTVEMAGGYRTLANDGLYTEITCIKDIQTNSGMSLELISEKKRVYSEDAARDMTSILQGVAKRGTARGLQLKKGMPFACKTGTTNNQTNGWFCGYTPYYSVACYVGYDDNRSMYGLWGSSYPMSIWRRVQNFLNQDKKIIKFKKKRKKVNVIEKNSEQQNDSNQTQEHLPVATSVATPTITEKPKEVQNLDVEESEVTRKPLVTEEPVATEEPVVTEEPIVTEEPVVTEESIVTEEPVITESPPEETEGTENDIAGL